jgi:hypothetical protein
MEGPEMTPLSPDELAEVTAQKTISDARELMVQLRGLRWAIGLLIGLLLFCVGWGVSAIRQQAENQANIASLIESQKDLKQSKVDHEEFNAVSKRLLDELAEIKAEQIRARESLERAARGGNR